MWPRGLPLDTPRGTQRSELPCISFLSAFVSPEPLLTTLGLDLGANLKADDLGLSSDLMAMLKPNRKYVIHHTLTSGISAQIPGLDFLKLSSGGEPTTYVVGADHPFFYYEGEFEFPFGDKPDADAANAESDPDASAASSDPADAPSDGEASAGVEPAAGDEPAQDPAKREKEDEDPEGEPPSFAVALDADGGIPFTPLRKVGVEAYMKGFTGHLYVRGPVPIATGVELDGTVVVDLDPDDDGDHPFEPSYYTSFDLALGGNGALAVALPFDFVDLSALGLELGEATATARVSEDEDAVVFSGLVASEAFLADLPIPIPIRPDARVEAWGRVSGQDPLGSYVHLAARSVSRSPGSARCSVCRSASSPRRTRRSTSTRPA